MEKISTMTLAELCAAATASQRRVAEDKATAVMASIRAPHIGTREMVIAAELKRMLKGDRQ